MAVKKGWFSFKEFAQLQTGRVIPLPPKGRIVFPRLVTGGFLCPHGRRFATARRLRMFCPRECQRRDVDTLKDLLS